VREKQRARIIDDLMICDCRIVVDWGLLIGDCTGATMMNRQSEFIN
jgi:hypothetical protein